MRRARFLLFWGGGAFQTLPPPRANRNVLTILFLALTHAPKSSKSATTSVLLSTAARCNAASPHSSTHSTSALPPPTFPLRPQPHQPVHTPLIPGSASRRNTHLQAGVGVRHACARACVRACMHAHVGARACACACMPHPWRTSSCMVFKSPRRISKNHVSLSGSTKSGLSANHL